MTLYRCSGSTILLLLAVCILREEIFFGRPRLVHACTLELPAFTSEAPELECSSDAISFLGMKSVAVKRTSAQRKANAIGVQNEVQEKLKPMNWEAGQVKVVYGVFTSPLPKYAAQLQAVLETWGGDVLPGKLLVVGVTGSNPNVTYRLAPNCPDGRENNAGISCKEATLLADGYSTGADWVVILGSDNYVFLGNFEKALKEKDPNVAQINAIWGCGVGAYCEDKQGGLCGGGGYAISRAALKRMIGDEPDGAKNFIKESETTAETVCGNLSDQVTSCIARRHHVSQVQLPGLYGWQICHDGDQYGQWCEFNEDKYRVLLPPFANPPTLTFHYIEPDVMYKIHQMKLDREAGIVDDAALMQLVTTNEQRIVESTKAAEEYEKHRFAYVQQMSTYMQTVLTQGSHSL